MRDEALALCMVLGDVLWQGSEVQPMRERCGGSSVRRIVDWVIVKIAEVLASVIIPDPTDGVWDEYERSDR